MNITEETKIIPPRWRATQGGEFAYITINSLGQIRITKSHDNRSFAEDSLWENGNYFRVSEVHNFADILKTLIRNRI